MTMIGLTTEPDTAEHAVSIRPMMIIKIVGITFLFTVIAFGIDFLLLHY
jgi:hypothetical protein